MLPVGFAGSSGAATKVKAAPKVLFSLRVSPTTVDIAPGTNSSVVITSTRTKGFSNPIYLGVNGLPAGVTVTTTANPLRTASKVSTLIISARSTMAPKNFTLTVSGSSKGQTSRATIKVRVGATTVLPTSPPTPTTLPSVVTTTTSPTTTIAATTTSTTPFKDYTLAVDPATVSVPAGGTTTATLKITRTGGFNEELLGSLENLPSGATGSIDPIPGTAATSTIRLTAGPSTSLGTTTVTVRVRGRTATFVLNVTSVGVTLTPASLTLPRGASGTTTAALSRAVSASNVTWTTDPLPAGVTAAFGTNGTTAVASLLTVTVNSAATPGTYAIGIRAASDSVSVAATLTLVITETTNSSTISPNPLALAPGASGTVAVTTTATGVPALSVVGLPAGASASYSVSGSVLTITISTTAATVPGSYAVTFTTVQGGIEFKSNLTLVIGTATVNTTSFTMTVPSAVSAAKGTTLIVTVPVTWSASVTPVPITFTVTGGPTGMVTTYTVNPNTVGTTVNLAIPAGAAAGTYAVAIVGTVAALGSYTSPVSLTVT